MSDTGPSSNRLICAVKVLTWSLVISAARVRPIASRQYSKHSGPQGPESPGSLF
ncbi:hypothetical protein [Kitasatospora fiedleri]|uniref:hypothetical protein n=1 Tax=Kitasatospora fiedleri TaxID=2991545 RepID=UPI00249A9065|nr:hypothetical protein [Kitasatospora fiedleri]